MARNRIDRTFDYDLRLKDAGLVAADAAAQVGSADKILDLGAGRMDGTVVVDDSAVGRYELPTTNEINGTVYRYMRLYTDVAGTIATGINYSANLQRAA